MNLACAGQVGSSFSDAGGGLDSGAGSTDGGSVGLDSGITLDAGRADDGGVVDAGRVDGGVVFDAGPPRRFDAGSGDGGIPQYLVAAPAGEWLALTGNTMQEVMFDYGSVATPAGYRTSLPGIMNAWSGAVYVTPYHRLFINGGGHRDYDGNEWYALNVERGLWERINDPSVFLESSANPDGKFPDGAPIPIHTYDCLSYSPKTDSLYRMGRGGSSIKYVWEFQLDTLTWHETSAPVSDPHSGTAHYNPDSGTILLLENNSQGAGYAAVEDFDPVTATKREVLQYGPLMSTVTGAFDTAAGELVFNGDTLLKRVDAKTGAEVPVTTTGDKRLEAVQAPGFTYDSRRDRFVGWLGSTKELFFLAKGTWAWTTTTPASGDTPVAAAGNGIFGRFQYVPEYDVFVLATTTNGPAFIYKPADWFQ